MNKTTDAVIVMQSSVGNAPQPHSRRSNQEIMTFRIYVRTFWMDFLLMALLGGLGLGVYFLRPAPDRVFPIYFRNGEIANAELTYPFRKDIIPIWLAALIAFIVPFIFIMLMQIRLRSFNDANAATMGLLYSLITAAVFQVFIKWLIGGLRPHFFSICKPNINISNYGSGQGFDGLLFDRSVCTGNEKEINDALESMPSGHSTAAFAGLVYCSLYLNSKLKIFANYRPQYWKFVLFYAPLLGAVLIAGSLTIDHYHHWYDILAGAVIGTMFAFGSYRCQYASVWDFRFNHIPLPRVDPNHGFDYQLDHLECSLSASRKGGWTTGHVHGAPFDAAMAWAVPPVATVNVADARL
jgi:diacylglycerol diphosphate phosphatase / phosphatidate phosphatase